MNIAHTLKRVLISASLGIFFFTSSSGMEQPPKETVMNISPQLKSNLTTMATIDPSLLTEIKKVLLDHFGKEIQIKSIVQLSEPKRRNLILRIILQPTEKFPHSLILKQTTTNYSKEDDKQNLDRFARDWAGLEFLSSLHPQSDATTPTAPQFLGGSLKHHFVLLEDLGEKHISLVDSLTGDNPEKAEVALRRFVTCMGQFHANSFGKTDRYNEILKHLNPTAESWDEELKLNLEKTVLKIASVLSHFDIPLLEEISSEIKQVIRANLEPSPFTAYIHGDICPDNVFDDPEKNELRLIDFEYGSIKNALLDGTYLRMGMPTCWCAKSVPDDLIEPLETIYREQLMQKIPEARNDTAYHDAYTNACAFWMLNTVRQIEKFLEKDKLIGSGPIPKQSLWNLDKNLARPRVITRLRAFLDVSIKYDRFPHLRSVAEQILEKLKVRWPDTKPMDVYPAFEKR